MSKTLAPIVTDEFTLIHGDCIEALSNAKECSVSLLLCSPPFADLFVYSKDDGDMGNAKEGVFKALFRCWAEQAFRVVQPGRIAALHVTQLLAYKVLHGFMGLRDFCGHVAVAMKEAGFDYVGEVAIAKNPQSAAQRMKLHNLMFTTLRKDSSKSVPVRNDYVLLFRRPGENAVPVKSFDRGEVTEEDWIRFASGVWDEIDETNVVQTRGTGDADDERHVCPLQLPVIDRLVRLYSNPGEVVCDPFNGVGSTGIGALKRGRRYLGIELKASYFKTAAKTLNTLAKAQRDQGAFDFANKPAAPAPAIEGAA